MDEQSSEEAMKVVSHLPDKNADMKTSDFYRVNENLPKRFNHPDCFKGYGREVHPLYRTTNQAYGSRKPTVHEMPTTFRGSQRKFSEDILKSGMFRDNGFNTSLERSRITGPNAIAMFQDKIIFHLSDRSARNKHAQSKLD